MRSIVFLTFFIGTFSLSAQESLTKDEVLGFFRKHYETSVPRLDSLFRLELENQTRRTFDDLLRNGVDTLLIFSEEFPGYTIKAGDSCSVNYPVWGYLFWRKSGNNFYQIVHGSCEGKKRAIRRDVLDQAVKKYPEIFHEFFMPVIETAEKRAGKVRYHGSSIDHEPKFSILIMINKSYKYMRFTKDELTNKASMFFGHNNTLISYDLYKLMVKEIERMK